MQAPGTEAPRRLLTGRAPVAVTVAPIMPAAVGPQSAYMPNASGPPDERTPIMPRPVPNAIAAGRGGAAPTTTAPDMPAQTMAPIAFAQGQYEEHGDPFTALAQGLVNAQAYREDQAQTQAKQEEAAKLLDGHPDLQEQVKNGVLDLSSAITLAQQRDELAKATDRKAKIVQYLEQAGDKDIAEQFANGVLDEDGVAKAIAAREAGPDLTADQKDLKEINKEREAAGQKTMTLEEYQGQKVGRGTNEFNMESGLNQQYSQADPLKTYQTVRNGYEKVRDAAKLGTGPGDISMIFAYMKMLDPTSVVREGEFATAQNSGGIEAGVVNLYNSVLNGQRLTKEQRADFIKSSEQIYSNASSNLADLNKLYTDRAKSWNINSADFLVQPETYDPWQAPDDASVPDVTKMSDEELLQQLNN